MGIPMFKVYSPKDEHIIYRALKLGVEKILWNLGFTETAVETHIWMILRMQSLPRKRAFLTRKKKNRPFGFPSLRNCICHKTSPSENQAAALAEAAGRVQQDETSVMSSKSLWFRSNFAYRKIVSVVFFANVSWFLCSDCEGGFQWIFWFTFGQFCEIVQTPSFRFIN